jgi:hypothetical protein
MTGAYTGITGLGTLTSLTIDGASSPAITLGDWSGGSSNSAIESNSGHLILGFGTGGAVYLRTINANPVYIGANSSNTLQVGNGTATVVGTMNATTFSGSGASLTSLPAGQLTGIVASACISGSYTGFTSITVDGPSSAAFTLGDWPPNANYGGVIGNKGYLLIGNNAGDDAMYLRTSTAGSVRIGANGTDTLSVGNGTSNFAGEIYATSNIRISTAGANFVAQNPTTSSGNAAQWLSIFGLFILVRNTSTRNDKENIQPLNGIVTPSMIDDIDISLWNRKNAEGLPEIGPMAEDMDDISPFLSIRGMDCDDEGNIVATDPTGINQNSWLSLLTLGIQDIRQRLQQLENP